MEEHNQFVTGDPFRSGTFSSELLPVPGTDVEQTIDPDDRVLLIRLGGIGDAVRLLPAAAYLRNNHFQGSLDCAVEPPVDEVFHHTPFFDHVHSIPLDEWWGTPSSLYRELSSFRERSYDWVFDCHGILKSGVLSRVASGTRRIGYHPENAKEANHLFQDHTITALQDRLPRILKYIQLLRPFTPSYSLTKQIIRPEFSQFAPITSDIQSAAEPNPILVHPTSSHGRYGSEKDWGLENFRSLLDSLLEESDHPVRITWGPGEKTSANKLAEHFGDRVQPAPETSPITNFCYLVQHATMLITIDSSPVHFADLLDTPVMVIFGVPKTWINAPLFTTYRLATVREGEETTSDIPADRVLRATRNLLASI